MLGMARPRRSAFVLSLLAAAIVAGAFGWDYWRRPVLFLGPMVQQVGKDGFAVSCYIRGADRVAANLYAGGQVQSAGTVTFDPAKGATFISFAGLDAGSGYEYEIVADGYRLARHRVRTAPADNRAFRFISLGDTGVGDRHQNNVARWMKAYRPDLIIHTGDLIYPRGTLEGNYRKFFQPYAELLAEVPVYVALGNHEFRMPGIPPVAEAFVFPPNGPADAPPEHNFWFDYGNTRFVAIDSNDDEPFFRDTIRPWLDGVLKSAGNRWKVVAFHEPVHTQGKYPPAAKLLSTIVPVLEAHGVELVLCGHNHMYERTHPVRGGKVCGQGEGTIYVTTGAGGANLAEARLPMPETIAVWEDREHSFTVADVMPDVLSLRQISETGRLIDQYQIRRRIPASCPAE